MPESTLRGPVEIIGVGLLGTSIGLALRRAGVEVLLSDVDADHVRTGTQLGAGRPREAGDRPALVVVAVPPAHLGLVIEEALDDTSETEAVVTDVGSVKSVPLQHLVEHPELRRYVGGHPMAGTERSGPLAASSDLFQGRPWAITPNDASDDTAVAAVTALATLCGAVPTTYDPYDHDAAVARISHLPHLMAALTALQLADAPQRHVDLSGPGVRDVTRVAGGSAALYGQIVNANADSISGLLRDVAGDLSVLISALDAGDARVVERLLTLANKGVARIPGKHGGPLVRAGSLFVTIPDAPGSLARLFAACGEAEVNIEDVHIDHDLGRQVGVVELSVDTAAVSTLATSLEAAGWDVIR